MKILSAEQIRALDKYTIEREPVTSINLMERASDKFVEAVLPLLNKEQAVYVFCGQGNNGGDGLAIARLLLSKGVKNVRAYVVRQERKTSSDFEVNYKRLKGTKDIVKPADFPAINTHAIIIDAIFGTGLSHPVTGLAAEVINKINLLGAKVYSVDVPSGLYCDKLNEKDDVVIRSSVTFTFHAPKLSFLLPANAVYVPEFRVLDIGLIKKEEDSKYTYITHDEVAPKFHARSKFSHKGTFGHALICAGSYGKIGAAVLSVSAALRSGAGLVSTHIPKCGYDIMQTSCHEAMVYTDKDENKLTTQPEYSKFTCIGLGPGIGQEPATVDFIEELLKRAGKPLVLDADALNIIAENRHLRALLPAGSILTPHPGEFKRLVGEWKDDLDKLQKQIDFAVQHKVVVVLKGANTSVATPAGNLHFNSTGNPGMAKGGSGDVLTGIITSLLAQGYDAEWAAIIGVYIHGLAGDLAAKELGQTALKAGDIIDYLGTAFKSLE